MNSNKLHVVESGNNSAEDDDSSIEKDSNFSICKIQKMIDYKMRTGENE
jgi:hypothetical protein